MEFRRHGDAFRVYARRACARDVGEGAENVRHRGEGRRGPGRGNADFSVDVSDVPDATDVCAKERPGGWEMFQPALALRSEGLGFFVVQS